jgi:hypothetical protein
MADWGSVAAAIAGVTYVKHAVITFNGTWGNGLFQYPSQVVAGLNSRNADLVYEVNCPYPATFGFVGGAVGAPSYQQSVEWAIVWMQNWLVANPTQTFVLIGYSQGAEAATRIYKELVKGTKYEANFIGGITFGNPCRGENFAAPWIKNPGGQGISETIMAELPTVNGVTVWADNVHSKANGDAGDDMYPLVTKPGAHVMTAFYKLATDLQLNDGVQFARDMVFDIEGAFQNVVEDLPSGLDAGRQGINFLAAPGGPTAPHISYAGEIEGYSDLVTPSIDFLEKIAKLTPARA